MKAEIKQKWLAALRSGDYQQGKNALRNERNEFCCLGVLCDLVAPAEWQFSAVTQRYISRHSHGAYLPSSIGNQVGLPDCLADTPMSMNDNGKSFAEIADWIEANIPAES